VAFYEAFFAKAKAVKLTRKLVAQAFHMAKKYGLSAVDSLHVAAAKAAGCVELYTTEGTGKPIFRVKGLRVKSIQGEI